MNSVATSRNYFLILVCFLGIQNLDAQVFAVDDVRATDEEESVTIDVQFNDINLDPGFLITYLITSPPNGTIELLDFDSILYTPDVNYYGIDTFTYGVSNSGEFFSTAQVFITILSQPDYPIAIDDYDTTTVETLVFIDVQVNDINFDPEPLETQIIMSPVHGTVEVDDEDSIQYIPDDGYYGEDAFKYAVCKPASSVYCDTAIVFMHIEQTNFFGPELVDDYVDVTEGSETNINVLLNDTDADGDALYVAGIFYDELAGTASINPDNTVFYDALSFGVDTIYYVGCDINSPSFCDTAFLRVNVLDLAGNIIVPNSFSPNGDGKHDYLEIEGLEAAFNLKIFNRWGDIVFETADINSAWDGTANVKSILPVGTVSEGTYFYILEIENSSTLQGYIELRR